MNKYQKFPLVEVTWLDHSGDAGWVDKESLNEAPCEMRTVGWLVHETKLEVKLMNTLSNDGGFGGVSNILKSCITKQKTLRKSF
jgi:hypothetical protein